MVEDLLSPPGTAQVQGLQNVTILQSILLICVGDGSGQTQHPGEAAGSELEIRRAPGEESPRTLREGRPAAPI